MYINSRNNEGTIPIPLKNILNIVIVFKLDLPKNYPNKIPGALIIMGSHITEVPSVIDVQHLLHFGAVQFLALNSTGNYVILNQFSEQELSISDSERSKSYALIARVNENVCCHPVDAKPCSSSSPPNSNILRINYIN